LNKIFLKFVVILFFAAWGARKNEGGVSRRHSMFIDEDQNILASADCGESNNTGLMSKSRCVLWGDNMKSGSYERNICLRSVRLNKY
jgi:hypothetical protein